MIRLRSDWDAGRSGPLLKKVHTNEHVARPACCRQRLPVFVPRPEVITYVFRRFVRVLVAGEKTYLAD